MRKRLYRLIGKPRGLSIGVPIALRASSTKKLLGAVSSGDFFGVGYFGTGYFGEGYW